MKNTFKILIPCLILSLMSATCNKLKSEEFISSALKYSTAGGVYGSGSSRIYQFNFSALVTDTFLVDTVYFLIEDNLVNRKLGNDNDISFYKMKDGTYQLDCRFSEGDRMQANGEIEPVYTPTYPKPMRMGENECLISGRYNGKYYEILIPKFTKGEDINYP